GETTAPAVADRVIEVALYTLTLGAITDPGTDTVTSYVINWGDGSNTSGTGNPSGQTATHTYADGPNSYTITVDLTDEDGTFTAAGSKAVSGANGTPTSALSGAGDANEGSTYTLILGAITDPGPDTVASYVVHWGDGSSTSVTGNPSGQTATHAYADGPNTYTITVDLTDEDGTFTGAGSKAVTVNNTPPTTTHSPASHVDY